MKILLFGDYSNYHACLGRALASMGHEVTVASDGGAWMNTARNYSLSRPLPGQAGGALLYLKLASSGRLKGYDVVSLINPAFAPLKPQRLRPLFDRLKKANGGVFLAAVGTDKAMMDFLSSADCELRYSEYYDAPGHIYEPNRHILQKHTEWQFGPIGPWCEYVYDNVKGVTTALYEYHLAMRRRIDADRLAYTGIPIETSAFEPGDSSADSSKKINLFLGRHSARQKIKGTDRLERAAARVAGEMPDRCSLIIVEDQPYEVYSRLLGNADIVLDQLYSYTPATNALMAMASGKATVSGAEPEFYDFIGETELHPIINAIPDDNLLYETIRDVVESPEKLRRAKTEGPLFVKKHNDAKVVAQRFLDFWTSKL